MQDAAVAVVAAVVVDIPAVVVDLLTVAVVGAHVGAAVVVAAPKMCECCLAAGELLGFASELAACLAAYASVWHVPFSLFPAAVVAAVVVAAGVVVAAAPLLLLQI